MKTYLLVLLLIFAGCKSSRKATTIKESQKAEIEISVSDTNVGFQIKNNLDEPLYILTPRKLDIYKFENDEWRKLKILICPCDAPCNAPEEKVAISAKETYLLTWNKNESWCGNRTPQGIRETVESIATTGEYKIVVSFNHNGNTFNIIKEFEIK